jgi:hypothetical protein
MGMRGRAVSHISFTSSGVRPKAGGMRDDTLKSRGFAISVVVGGVACSLSDCCDVGGRVPRASASPVPWAEGCQSFRLKTGRPFGAPTDGRGEGGVVTQGGGLRLALGYYLSPHSGLSTGSCALRWATICRPILG